MTNGERRKPTNQRLGSLTLSNFYYRMGGLGTLTTVAGRFTTQAQFDRYAAFLSERQAELGSTATSLNNSLNTLRETNSAWDARYMKGFIDHLDKLKSSAPVTAISVAFAVILLVVLHLLN